MPDAAQAAHQRQLEDEPQPLRGHGAVQKLSLQLGSEDFGRRRRVGPPAVHRHPVLQSWFLAEKDPPPIALAPRTATGRRRARSPARCRPPCWPSSTWPT
jgi:hypothetical protein